MKEMIAKQLAIGFMVILLMAGVSGASASAPQARDWHSHDLQVLTPGLPGWQQMNNNGFDDLQAGEVSALEAFKGYLYAGIHSDLHDARIYRSSDGSTWIPVSSQVSVFPTTSRRAPS